MKDPTTRLADVDWLLYWVAMLLPGAAVVVALFGNYWPTQRFLIFYVAPLFYATPTWLRLWLADGWPPQNTVLWIDAAVLILAVLRFVIGWPLPYSGHTLFLTYSGLTTPRRGYRLLAIVLLAETTWFKLWLWRDPYTWFLGIVLGLLAYERWRSTLGARAAVPTPD